MNQDPRYVINEALLKGLPNGDLAADSSPDALADVLSDQVAEALFNAGVLLDGEITTLEVRKALMPVETVEAYGLRIRLDANGDASEVICDRGWGHLA